MKKNDDNLESTAFESNPNPDIKRQPTNPLHKFETKDLDLGLAIPSRWDKIVTEVSGNFNAALVTSLVSIPSTLSLILAINYHAKPEQMINPTLGIINLVIGFSLSFFINGGTKLFKSFTATQAFLLMMLI